MKYETKLIVNSFMTTIRTRKERKKDSKTETFNRILGQYKRLRGIREINYLVGTKI